MTARTLSTTLAFATLAIGTTALWFGRKLNHTPATPTPSEVRGAPIRPQNPPGTPAPSQSASTATPTPSPGPTPDPKTGAEVLTIGFDRLASYSYIMPDEPGGANSFTNNATPPPDQIPKPIRELSNQTVSLKGFMLPLKVEAGMVTELLLMKDQSMCCYGNVPRINEWVSVKMKGKGVKPIMDTPVTFVGQIHVGETLENGYLTGIYSMDGQKIVTP